MRYSRPSTDVRRSIHPFRRRASFVLGASCSFKQEVQSRSRRRSRNLPVMLIKARPARFSLAEILQYRLKRAFCVHSRSNLASRYLRSVSGWEKQAIFCKWLKTILRAWITDTRRIGSCRPSGEATLAWRRGWCVAIVCLSPGDRPRRRGQRDPLASPTSRGGRRRLALERRRGHDDKQPRFDATLVAGRRGPIALAL